MSWLSFLDLNVSISISYVSPDQYPGYVPPNYRAASSVTLRCVASGTTGHVTYRWSSTCGSCFASSSSSQNISETVLRSRDAGVHTCSVTDSLGNTGSDVITMNIVGKQSFGMNYIEMATTIKQTALFLSLSLNTNRSSPLFNMVVYLFIAGAGIYVSQSLGTGAGGTTGPQPNNSYAIIDTSRSNINSNNRGQIYCCSNSSYSTGSITLPGGTVITSNYDNLRITRYTGNSSTYAGCIRLYHDYYYHSSYSLSSSYRGIYTCNILDSNNVNIPVSIGFYSEYMYIELRISNLIIVLLSQLH